MMTNKKTVLAFFCCTFLYFGLLQGQVSAGSLLGLPRATTAEINAVVNPQIGALVYNTDDDKIYRFTATGWQANTDDQLITDFNLDDTNRQLTLSLEDGGTQTVDFTTVLAGAGTDDQEATEVNLTTPIDIDNDATNETTVEGAINALNNRIQWRPIITADGDNAIENIFLADDFNRYVYFTEKGQFAMTNDNTLPNFGADGNSGLVTVNDKTGLVPTGFYTELVNATGNANVEMNGAYLDLKYRGTGNASNLRAVMPYVIAEQGSGDIGKMVSSDGVFLVRDGFSGNITNAKVYDANALVGNNAPGSSVENMYGVHVRGSAFTSPNPNIDAKYGLKIENVVPSTAGANTNVYSIHTGLGQHRFGGYGTGSHTGTPAGLLGVEANGDVIEVDPGTLDTNTTNASLTEDGTNIILTDSDGGTVTLALSDIAAATNTNTTNASLTEDGTNLILTDSDGATVTLPLADIVGTVENLYTADGTLTGNRTVTQDANTLAFTGTAVNAFSVDGTTLSVDAENDRVGIGTNSPETSLQVATPNGGNFLLSGENAAVFQMREDDTNNSWYIISDGTDLNIREDDTSNGNTRFAIQDGGNVGIGTTAPQRKLEVRAPAGEAIIRVGGPGQSEGTIEFGNQRHGVKRGYNAAANDVGLFTANGNIHLSTNNNAGDTSGEFILTDGGNVGIGSADPSVKLDVAGVVKVGSGNTVDGQGLQMVWNNGAIVGASSQGMSSFLNHRGLGPGGFTWSQTNDNVNFIEFMRLSSGGRLGLNTNAPTARLDVNGNARIQNIAAGDATDGIVTTDADGNLRQRTAAEIVASGGGNIDTNTTNASLTEDGTNIILTDSDGATVTLALSDIAAATNTNTTNASLTEDGTNLILTDSDGATVTLPLADIVGTVENLYTADGTLTGNRTVTLNDNDLIFESADGTFVSIDGTSGALATGGLNLGQGNPNVTTNAAGLSFYSDKSDASGTSNWEARIIKQPGIDGNLNVINAGSGQIDFRVNGNGIPLLGSSAIAMSILANTDVGIGTNAPTTKLDVNGNARVRTLPAGAATDGIVTTDADGNLRQRTLAEIAGAGADGDAWGVTGEDQAAAIGRTGDVTITNTSKTALTLQTADNALTNGLAFQNSGGFYSWNIFREPNATDNANGELVFAGGTNSASADGLVERMRIASNGRVGIGTDNPTRRLDVNGIVGVFDGTRTTNAGMATEVDGGLINIGTNDGPTNRFGGTYNDAQQGGFIRVDSRNNQSLFQVKGRQAGATTEVLALMDVESDGALRLNQYGSGGFTGTATGYLGVDANGNVIETAAAGLTPDGDAWGVTGEDTASAIGRTGNVGIGTTTPSTLLDLGNALGRKLSFFNNGSLFFGMGLDTGRLNFFSAAGPTDGPDMTLYHNSGNVRLGIGTDTPTSTLSVAGGISTTSAIELGELGTGDRTSFIDFHAEDGVDRSFRIRRFPGADGVVQLQNSGTGAIQFLTDFGQTAMTINSSANSNNVGIGIVSAEAKLDVNGTARIRNIAAGDATDAIITTDAGGNIRKRTLAEVAGAGADGDAWGVTGEDQTSDITRSGNIEITGTQGNFSTDESNNGITGTARYVNLEAIRAGDTNAIGGFLFRNTDTNDGATTYTAASIEVFNTDQGNADGADDGKLLFQTADDGVLSTKMVIENRGNVGIGQTNPEAKLTVNSPGVTDATGGLRLENGSSNSVVYQNADSDLVIQKLNQDNQLVLNNDGRVGINTDDPSVRLDVNGFTRIRSIPNGATTDVVITADADGNIRQRTPAQIVAEGGGVTATDGDAWGVTGEDQTANIGRTGNVTLTNTNRNALTLQVDDNTASTGLAFQNASGNYTWNIFREANATDVTDAELVFAGGANATSIDGLTERMRLDNNGNLGIGTNNPLNTLQVAGGTSANDAFFVNNVATTSRLFLGHPDLTAAQGRASIAYDRTLGDFFIRTTNAGVLQERMMIDGPTGNVGIGTATPSEKLDVNGEAVFRGGSGGGSGNAGYGAGGDQINLSFNGSSDFRHVVRSRHSASSPFGNSIDFILWNQPTDLIGADPTARVMTLATRAGGAPAVGIGAAEFNPTQLLDVRGGNISVTGGSFIDDGTTITAPDYVFEKYFNGSSALKEDYSFTTLETIEQFVKEHKHLPGIKSAYDIQKEGWDLSFATRFNLEKAEELFLHTIEQEKAIKELKAENEALKNRLDAIEKMLLENK